MKYLFLVLFFYTSIFAELLIFEAIISDEEKVYLEQKKEIKMCVDPDWMPFEKLDNGRHVGMASEYFSMFSKKIDTPIVIVPTKTWSETIEYAKQRKCDIFSLAMATPERLEYMNFTTPYISAPLVITTQITKPFIEDPLSIQNNRLGITKGYAYIEILKAKYPQINLIEFETLNAGLEAVRRGTIFGFIDNLITSGYAIQKNYIGELKVAGKFDDSWELSIGVRNDDLILLSVFNKVISSIKNEEYREVINRWISVQYESGFDYDLFWKIGAVLVFIFSFVFYRHYSLNKYTNILKEKEGQLQVLSITDALSGLYNRRYFDEIFTKEYNRAKRDNSPLIFAMFDIDYFKKYNDTYGHQLGDDVILKVSNVLHHHTRRSGDYAFRIGGEEFAVILQSSGHHDEESFFTEIVKDVRNLQIQHKENPPLNIITISGGVSKLFSYKNMDKLELYKFTDESLYEAKESGRDKIIYKNIVK